MKNAQSLEKSRKARLLQASNVSSHMADLTREMLQRGITGDDLKDLRNHSSKLTQCIHELNAYHNCLETT